MSAAHASRDSAPHLEALPPLLDGHSDCLPAWVSAPPIEAVVFAWGASEDHQLGLDTEDNIDSPKVVESLLGIKFAGCVPAR